MDVEREDLQVSEYLRSRLDKSQDSDETSNVECETEVTI